MKKALIVTTIGGFVSRFELDNVKIMQELGYEVHYASNFDNKVYEFDKNDLLDRGIKLHQVNIDKDPYNLIGLYKCYKGVLEVAKIEDVDLIHCHTPVGAVIGRLVGRKIQCKVIYTAHGFHFYKGSPIKNWILYYPVERLLAKYTDCLITINKEDYERSLKLGAKKCILIPSIGLDMKKFVPRKQYKRNYDRFKIVSIGELNKNKNHQIVIRAIEKLNDKSIEYYIYGKGKCKKKLEKLIIQKGLEKQIHLCGYTDNVSKVLEDADCFIFPSIREGFGMAGIEAMACGVVVIAAENRGSREYIIHGENAFMCNANDVDSFVNYIQKIKDNPEMAETISKKGVETVQRFSKERTNQIMQQVYWQINL